MNDQQPTRTAKEWLTFAKARLAEYAIGIVVVAAIAIAALSVRRTDVNHLIQKHPVWMSTVS